MLPKKPKNQKNPIFYFWGPEQNEPPKKKNKILLSITKNKGTT